MGREALADLSSVDGVRLETRLHVREVGAPTQAPAVSHVAAFALLNDEGESRDVLFVLECDAIKQVLTQCGGNVSEAAKRLGIHRQSLQRKIKRMP
jgi:transcriptional regulator with PAS, ATPase and Fis domain